jgi:hypothetical protein
VAEFPGALGEGRRGDQHLTDVGHPYRIAVLTDVDELIRSATMQVAAERRRARE